MELEVSVTIISAVANVLAFRAIEQLVIDNLVPVARVKVKAELGIRVLLYPELVQIGLRSRVDELVAATLTRLSSNFDGVPSLSILSCEVDPKRLVDKEGIDTLFLVDFSLVLIGVRVDAYDLGCITLLRVVGTQLEGLGAALDNRLVRGALPVRSREMLSSADQFEVVLFEPLQSGVSGHRDCVTAWTLEVSDVAADAVA